MQTGFVKLPRRILDADFYQKPNERILFIHLLLLANYKEGTWNGIRYERGELITSLDSLSRQTGLTVSQVRTAIKNLESRGVIQSRCEVARQIANDVARQIANHKRTKNRVISILGWDEFSGIDKGFSKGDSNQIDSRYRNNKEKKEEYYSSVAKGGTHGNSRVSSSGGTIDDRLRGFL